jgi:predicted Rossmann fold nucleotide-binding protein DprA/Smf involved in DNA uptake
MNLRSLFGVSIGIVGDRNFTDVDYIEAVLSQYCHDNDINIRNLTFISGSARGVDSVAKSIANHWSVPFVEHLPKGHNNHDFLNRNKRIVRDSDVLLAFPTKSSKGTYHTISLAEEKGIPVLVTNVTNKVFDEFTLEGTKLLYTPDNYKTHK